MSKVIVALDGMTKASALLLASKLTGKVWGFKVNDLLLDCGVEIITALKHYGKVFADPKLFDIPNTVSNSVKKLRAAGADFITVHAMGGPTMLRAAVAESDGILAVTILTSMKDEELAYLHSLPVTQARRMRVSDLAFTAHDCRCRGIICSATDLEYVGHYRLLKVVPGIRPDFLEPVRGDDQVHKGQDSAGDLLVVGRPIVQAEDPVAVCDLLNERL
jgi:orotidine-5'-phosphate decarboxylase